MRYSKEHARLETGRADSALMVKMIAPSSTATFLTTEWETHQSVSGTPLESQPSVEPSGGELRNQWVDADVLLHTYSQMFSQRYWGQKPLPLRQTQPQTPPTTEALAHEHRSFRLGQSDHTFEYLFMSTQTHKKTNGNCTPFCLHVKWIQMKKLSRRCWSLLHCLLSLKTRLDETTWEVRSWHFQGQFSIVRHRCCPRGMFLHGERWHFRSLLLLLPPFSERDSRRLKVM